MEQYNIQLIDLTVHRLFDLTLKQYMYQENYNESVEKDSHQIHIKLFATQVAKILNVC